MIDLQFTSDLKPEKGRLLISEPFLQDNYFERSVVLICDYNSEGAFGFVLNKYLDVKFEEMAEVLPSFDTKVSLGGPVNKQHLFFIHTLDQLPGAVQVNKEIYAGGDFDLMLNMIKKGEINNQQIRFFLGYSGWSPGQLEAEIELNSWIVSPSPSSDLLMNAENESLWEILLEKKGGKFKLMSKFPQNPQMN